MKKTSLYLTAFISLIGIFASSCQDDDSIERRGKPTVTVENKTVTVTEGETATFNLNVEYPVANKIDIRIDVLDEQGNPIVVVEPADGDANSGNGYVPIDLDDIVVPYNTWFDSGYFQYGYQGGSGYIATFPPGVSSFDIDIETLQDELPNATKTVTLRFTATNLLEVLIDEEVTINIENYVGEDLITRLNWAGDYLDSGEEACDIDTGLDLDLELIYDGDYVQTSYDFCPEELIILGTDPDGTYTIDASFWTGNGNTSADNLNIPVTIDFIKPGVFSQTVDLSSLFPLNDGGLNDGNDNAITSFTVEKTGTIYTVTDSNNTQIAQGRFSAPKRSIQEKRILKNRRINN
ncbi:MAG: hypothetical protein R2797_10735 [Gelidibacter sp.]